MDLMLYSKELVSALVIGLYTSTFIYFRRSVWAKYHHRAFIYTLMFALGLVWDLAPWYYMVLSALGYLVLIMIARQIIQNAPESAIPISDGILAQVSFYIALRIGEEMDKLYTPFVVLALVLVERGYFLYKRRQVALSGAS